MEKEQAGQLTRTTAAVGRGDRAIEKEQEREKKAAGGREKSAKKLRREDTGK